MNDLEKYFIVVIIVWRLTHLISSEDGPFDFIIKIRKFAGNSFFGTLMDCFYCLSIWIGLLCACFVSRCWQEIVVLTLYYSGASILLEKLTNKNFN
ncbi:DUF1360 domain-containing protein [Flavobacterium sp. N3904]|uniref:DUF1360 domain-containing protein n=1 Tax=Flavobacterium sp. N3904 TaxID=2986835 RepID=UPI0022247D45|nr:DUF1360 domain-containing protein [Flavobacterium sp. N3904]